MGLHSALALFETTLAVLQTEAAVARVAAEICEDASREGVSTLEIRFAPQLHRGATMEAIVDAALEGINGRAGLVLCGLYGEPSSVFDRFLDVASSRTGVVGIDLAGGPQSGDQFSMENYAPTFSRARELGIGRTVHAGEGRPPTEIERAITVLHAERIGHGTTLLDDERVTDLVLEHDVVIEACITSNWHTGAITRIDDHPLARWLDRGVRVCINTDNTLFSRTDAVTEHQRASALLGSNAINVEVQLAGLIRTGHDAAFERR